MGVTDRDDRSRPVITETAYAEGDRWGVTDGGDRSRPVITETAYTEGDRWGVTGRDLSLLRRRILWVTGRDLSLLAFRQPNFRIQF